MKIPIQLYAVSINYNCSNDNLLLYYIIVVLYNIFITLKLNII